MARWLELWLNGGGFGGESLVESLTFRYVMVRRGESGGKFWRGRAKFTALMLKGNCNAGAWDVTTISG